MRSIHLVRTIGILVLLTTVLTGSAMAQAPLPRPAADEAAAAAPQGHVQPQANLALWRTEIVIGIGDVGQWTSIALHPTTGQPGIIYLDISNGALIYIRRTCSPPPCTWTKEAVDAAGGRGASLAYDASGNPHVSYYRSGAFRYAHSDGVSWQTTVVYSASSDLPHTSLALDSQGRPRFTASVTIEGALYYFYYDGTSWHSDPIEYGLSLEDGFPSLVLDNLERPYISFRENGYLILAHYDGATWQFDPSAEDNAFHTSMGMDSYGRLHIAYYDGHNSTLRYALFDGALWTYETVDTVGYWSYFTGTCSLQVRPAGAVFISYYDAVNGRLKYAAKTGLTWDVEVVDGQANVGEYNALAVNDKNLPFIAYYDATNGDLKLAYRVYGIFLPILFRNG